MEFIKPFASFIPSFSDKISQLDKLKLCLKDPAFLMLLLLNIITWGDVIINDFYCA